MSSCAMSEDFDLLNFEFDALDSDQVLNPRSLF